MADWTVEVFLLRYAVGHLRDAWSHILPAWVKVTYSSVVVVVDASDEHWLVQKPANGRQLTWQ